MQIGHEFEGRYRILSELGRGGYATVWLAEHVKIGQKVAIKMTHEPGADPRFLREAKILATLKSPHTVRIMDFGETAEGHAFMISEFIEGESLDEIRRRGPLPAAEVTNMLAQALESLAEAHQNGIVHRDIKPANLMRMPDGTIKVLDFGIARVAEPVNSEGLTAAGVVLGTPRYLAPECLLAPESVTAAADVFALGLVAYALLTGEDANAGLSSRQIVARTLSNEPFTLPEALLLPTTLSRWIVTATAKSVDRRFADAAAALHALRTDGRMDDSTVTDAPLGESKRTYNGAPHAIARPAADSTLDETGALAFGAAQHRNTQPEHGILNPLSNEPHGTGLIELDLDLGNEAAPAIARIERRLPQVDSGFHKRPPLPERGNRPLWLYGLIGLVVIAAAGTATAAKLGYISFERERPMLSPVPDDPPEVIKSYEQGKLAFDEGRWEDALAHFQRVEQQPNTNSARDLIAKDYVGRIIGDVLEDAVDARERAETAEDLELASEGPLKLLKFYPEHDATRYVLNSIEAAGKELGKAPEKKPATKRPKKSPEKKKPPKIERLNLGDKIKQPPIDIEGLF